MVKMVNTILCISCHNFFKKQMEKQGLRATWGIVCPNLPYDPVIPVNCRYVQSQVFPGERTILGPPWALNTFSTRQRGELALSSMPIKDQALSRDL